jgi:transcriptional regulator with XRE-family HTH domain
MFEIGSSLREARVRQGLDLEELEQRTKIRRKYLRALEEEQFEQLPGHTYIKGFLRTYADALDLDGQMYADEYSARFVGDEEEAKPLDRAPRPRVRRSRERRESRVLLVALIVIGIATALVFVAWKFGGPEAERVPGLAPAGATTARSGATPIAKLEVRAPGGDSFMEVRAGSRTGQPLYRGTIEQGQVQRFARRNLYVRLGSPANLALKLNGNRVELPNGRAFVVSPAGVRTAAAS